MTKKKKSDVGAPTKFTAETIQKLTEAFLWGCSNAEACLHAGISKSCFYNYKKENKEFLDRIELLCNSPKLKARMIINKKLDESDSDIAKWYLERKAKDEFSTKVESDQNVTFTQMGSVKKEEKGEIKEISFKLK